MDRAFDFLIGRKHSRKDRQVKVSFRELKTQIYWPTTDQWVCSLITLLIIFSSSKSVIESALIVSDYPPSLLPICSRDR